MEQEKPKAKTWEDLREETERHCANGNELEDC
ncbi:hypothetical protein LCGC14_1587600 [marine sediment metagenome]|uniref:Uncharacterized protein n=1 Tax=marine sediment metagenome TaxID=412755 RepID=A0A0F9IEX5_9ZZZZ